MSDNVKTETDLAAPQSEPRLESVPAVPETPAASLPEAPVATPAPAATAPTFGSFSNARGSGLARGKRNTTPAASNAAAPSDYKPTAIEIVKTATSFANPFTPVVAPTAEPSPSPAPAAEVQAPSPEPQSVAPLRVADISTVEVSNPAPAPASSEPEAGEAPKSALNILPPTEAKRPTQSWENRPQRREGGDFRPRREERREGGEIRPRREERREGGEVRSEPRRSEPRNEARAEPRLDPRGPLPAKPVAPAKAGGLVGWFKGFFGKKDPAPSAPQGEKPREGEGSGGDSGYRRRENFRRGEGRPYDSDRQGRQGQGQGGFDQGQGGGDPRRRRRRGGRGRQQGGDFRQGGGEGSGPGPQA